MSFLYPLLWAISQKPSDFLAKQPSGYMPGLAGSPWVLLYAKPGPSVAWLVPVARQDLGKRVHCLLAS